MPITGEDADDLVGPAITVQGGEDARGKEIRTAKSRPRKVSCRVIGSAFATRSVTWFRRAHTVGAEVAVEHVPQVAAVLNEEGVVETVLNTVLFEGFGSRRLTQCRVGRVDRRQRHDEEDERTRRPP